MGASPGTRQRRPARAGDGRVAVPRRGRTVARTLGSRGIAASLVTRDVPPLGGGGVVELLPTKATFAPGEPIVVEARDLGGSVRLSHLDRIVAEAPVED